MDNKNLSIGAVAILAFFVFWGGAQLSRQQTTNPLESDSFLDYVIPKLKQFIPKFSLWNRKFVDRRKLAPKGPAGKTGPLAQAAATGTPTPTTTPTPTPVAKATNTPTPNAGPGTLAVNTLGETPNSDSSDPALSNPYGGNANLAGPTPTETPSPDTQIGEWKMKIYRSPYKDTMNDFVFEFQTGKVPKTVFYQVLEDLMKDASPEIQTLAVYALTATPSYDSLTALLSNKDHLASETQSMVRIALEGYAKPDKLKILEIALKSENPPLVLGAMPLIIKIGGKMTLWSADYSSLEGNDRDRRGPTNRIPKNGFIEVINTLNELESSSDHQISQAARDTLNQLNYRPPTASRRE